VQIHAGHHQSTGEGMAVAMPRKVFEPGPLDRSKEPAPGTLGVGKYEVSIRFFSQSFQFKGTSRGSPFLVLGR